MNAFFCLRFFFALTLIPSFTFSQNIIKSRDNSYVRKESSRWTLNKYLWTVAKYKISKYNKHLIDFDAIDNWQRVGDYLSISNNGKYFAYSIERGGVKFGPRARMDSLIVQSVGKPWRIEFVESKPGFFTDDSRQYIFQKGMAICFLRLDDGHTTYVKDVLSFKVSGGHKKKWMAYQLKNEGADVVLRQLGTGTEKIFHGVSDYRFYNNSEWFVCQSKTGSENGESKGLILYQLASRMERRFPFVVNYVLAENGKSILLRTKKEVDKETITALEYVSLQEGTRSIIWSTRGKDTNVSNCNMDSLGEQVVFSVLDSSGLTTKSSTTNSIWYYKKGMTKAVVKVTNNTPGVEEGLQIGGSVSFTDNGRYIKFILQDKSSANKADSDGIQPEVWSHKDFVLQSAQSTLSERYQRYNSIVNVESGRIIQFKSEGKILDLLHGDFAIVKSNIDQTYGDRFWVNGYGRDSNWLVNLNDGSRYLLGSKDGAATEIGPFWFSPSGNYLVYFDFGKERRYFSYDLRTRKLVDISVSIKNNNKELGYVDPYLRTDGKPKQPLGIAGWLKEDAGVLVYDNNDVWQFDLRGDRPAINLTNGFGQSHNIIFSLFNNGRFDDVIPVLEKDESLLLRAFNTKDKYSGFYRKVVGVKGDPELLYIGKYFSNVIPGCQNPGLSNKGMQPIKANDVNTWIVQRQSDSDAPNYYKTSDFKSFKRLTNFQPQRNYNWLSEELHSFKHLDGAEGQGILYKPENFDSSKRYPVVIVFYGGYSNSLYQFPVPAYNMTTITPGESPIWFLNNGYLVFTPDIYVSPLKYGPEAFNVLEGAAKYLKQLPYVDKLGCCSHSWSAKLGAYLFTHSKSFSAMAISEGFLYANMINVAFSADEEGVSKLESVEEGFQFGSLWENKDSWLDQTTILNANNAASPLLLFCNKKSIKDYQDQTLQLFTALRRLEKKVWWLKYSKGGHTLRDLDERKDFTIRYTQFFDHYLKNAPAPRWMTRGFSTRFNEIEYGYELDPVGNCGADCEICKQWNEQYKRHPEMFDKPISEWSLN